MTTNLKSIVILLKKLPLHYFLYLILAMTCLVYTGLFYNQEYFIYDDPWYIFENPNVINLSWDSIINIFTSINHDQYSPLSEVYHGIIYYFFGDNLLAFNFFALVNHLVNSLLLFLLLKRLNKGRILIIFVTAIFALHPMQVETLGWISVLYRLAVMFHLIGALYYIKYLEQGQKIKNLIPVLICFIASLFIKELAVLFPVALLVIRLIKGTSLLDKKFTLEFIMWGSICLIYGLLYLNYAVQIQIRDDIGVRAIPFVEKLYILFYTGLSYIKHFLFPFKLSFNYTPINETPSTTEFISIFSIGILIIIGLVYGSIKNKTFRYGVFWAFGFLSLALAFSFFKIRPVLMYDHYIYMAIIGFAICFILILKKISLYFFKNSFSAVGTLTVFCLILTTLSFTRVKVFQNEENLWANVICVDSSNVTGIYYYGASLRRKNKLDEAQSFLIKGIKKYPNIVIFHTELAKVYVNKKNYAQAIKHANIALSLDKKNIDALDAIIVINNRLKNDTELIKNINKILDLKPKNKLNYIQARAKAYYKLKQYKKAYEDCIIILQEKPKDANFNYIAGHSLFILKKYKDAEKYLTQAITINDKDGSYYFYRGLARQILKKHHEAAKDMMKAKALGYKMNTNLDNFFKKVFKAYGYK